MLSRAVDVVAAIVFLWLVLTVCNGLRPSLEGSRAGRVLVKTLTWGGALVAFLLITGWLSVGQILSHVIYYNSLIIKMCPMCM